MAQRLGNVIYWMASGVALLVGCYVVFRGEIVGGFVIAGLAWLAGKAARYVLAG
jgi:hypothetical protein